MALCRSLVGLSDPPPVGVCRSRERIRMMIISALTLYLAAGSRAHLVSTVYGVYALTGSILLTMMGISLMFEKNLIRLGNVSCMVVAR